MKGVVRWLVVALALVHGLLHLIGVPLGWWWVLTAVLVVAAGVALALRWPGWWTVMAVAAVASQVVLFTAWSDAWAGTLANLVLLAAAAYGFAAHGRRSARAEFRRRAVTALGTAGTEGVVAEDDLERLPPQVARYLRACGAVGARRVGSFRARVHGRIRAGADEPWMRFRGEQVNTYGPRTTRLFFIDATMAGLPVDVLHVYADGAATMRVRWCSAVPIARGQGPEMTRAETVTLFNDLCVLAPAALVDAPVTWEVLDPHRVRGRYTHAGRSVTAELVFDEAGQLVDFVSDDRLRSSADGHSFTGQRWSTPLSGYRELGGRRIAAVGSARWHAPAPEGEFDYLEFVVDELTCNAGPEDVTTR